MEIRDKVYSVAARVFATSTAELNDELSVGDIKEWDSLGQTALVAALEKEFSCEFDIDEVLDMESLGDIVEIIGEIVVTQ